MKYLLLVSLLTGCATFNHRGINVYDRQVDTNLTNEQAIVILDYALDILGPDSQQVFDGWDVVFMSGYWGQLNANGDIIVADGVSRVEDTVIFIKVYSCFGDNALLHEMSHVYLWAKTGNGDRNHEDRIYWQNMAVKEERMIELFCDLDYTPKRRFRQ